MSRSSGKRYIVVMERVNIARPKKKNPHPRRGRRRGKGSKGKKNDLGDLILVDESWVKKGHREERRGIQALPLLDAREKHLEKLPTGTA